MGKPINLDESSDSDDLQALFDTIAAAAPPVEAPAPTRADSSGDSDDLQALFDTVAATATPVVAAAPAPVAPPPPAPSHSDATGDSDDLQALFDSVASTQAPAATAATSAEAAGSSEHGDEVVFNKLGHLARNLHDSLRALGYDKALEQTASQIPDARERLTYIAKMTEQAASKVLNAADIAKPIQDDLIARSQVMSGRWDKMFANQLSVDEFKLLAADTRAYFGEAPAKLQLTNAQLMEIVMAQDFQDLTGQVIKKVVEMVQDFESQLMGVLIEAMPEQRKASAPEGLMNGPVINAAQAGGDVMTSQSQVDDLLESLGF